MNELICINYNSEQPTVLGRDLHEALEVKTAYKDWFPRMCEYGFEEGKDFNPLKNERLQIEGNRKVARIVTDHQCVWVRVFRLVSSPERNENYACQEKSPESISGYSCCLCM